MLMLRYAWKPATPLCGTVRSAVRLYSSGGSSGPSTILPEHPAASPKLATAPPPSPTASSHEPHPTTAGFVPRPTFPHHNLPTSYFLGHHRAGLTRIKQLLSSVNLVLECRDYRVPLSSRNPLFEEALAGKPRIIVYTKKDLGDPDEKTRQIISSWHPPRETPFFIRSTSTSDLRRLLKHIQTVAVEDDILTGTRMLVLGMPNVGKSTLLNTLRRYSLRMEEKERKKKKAQAPPSDEPSPATKSRTSKSGTTEYQWEKGPQYIAKKVAKTGAQPGITRSISSLILLSREPLVYIYDTPGIFIPHLPDPETMLKLSLAGSVKDGLVPAVTVADYLLYRINLLGEAGWKSYKKWCPHPTNDVLEWLRGIARRTGKLARVKQGEQTRTTAAFTTADDLEDEDFQSLQSAEQEDLDAAAQWAIARYREGGWGKWGLDEVKEDGLIKDREDREGWGESLRQARLRIRREGKESREAKNSGDGDA